MTDKKDLTYAFSNLLGTETIIRRQRKTQINQKKQLFLSIIQKYDDALMKSVMLDNDFQIDLSKYEDPFYNLIDEMFLLSWGDDIYKLIAFYFYGRRDEEMGEEIPIETEDGSEIYLRSPEDLYNLINKLYPNII